MKQLLFVVLAIFLIGCAAEQPAQEPAPTAPAQQTQENPNLVETPQPEVVKPSTTTTAQTRTGKTHYFVMTIDDDGFDPPVLTVPWSERIKLTLTNEDSKEHSFDIAELKLAYTLKAKETVVIDFIPTQKGGFKIDDRFSEDDGELIVGGET